MLSFEQGRVLGVLIEKLLTTPDQMPLSVNACMLGCNQKTNRNPVVNFSESEVLSTLVQLQSKGYVMHCSGAGSRVDKFTQNLDRVLEISREDICLLSILMLRGAQTPGELSTRSKRAWPEGNLEQIETKLKELSQREQPLVQRLERLPGQKESRWKEVLTSPAETVSEASPVSENDHEEIVVHEQQDNEELLSLKDEVGFLRDEVSELREMIEHLQAQLGESS